MAIFLKKALDNPCRFSYHYGKNTLNFKVSGAINLLEGLFTSREGKEEIVSFKEVPKENIEIELNELKNKLLTEELANIKLYIEKKDYINTKTSSDLIDSLGGRMDKVTEENLLL